MRYFLCLLLLATTAHADLYPYNARTFSVRLVCGGGVDCQRAQRTFGLSRAYIEPAVNIRLNLKEVIEIREEMTGSPTTQLMKWATRLLPLSPVDVTIIALDPYSPLSDHFDVGSTNVLGLASGIGVIGDGPCGAFSRIIGSEVLASKVMIHEIGHLLGATHTKKGIMYPSVDVGQYTNAYSQESLEEIQAHLASLP